MVEFLKTMTWRPQLIVFVDDRIDHLYAVENAIKAFCPEITLKGFHYQTNTASYQTVDAETFRKTWETHVNQAKKLCSQEATADRTDF